MASIFFFDRALTKFLTKALAKDLAEVLARALARAMAKAPGQGLPTAWPMGAIYWLYVHWGAIYWLRMYLAPYIGRTRTGRHILAVLKLGRRILAIYILGPRGNLQWQNQRRVVYLCTDFFWMGIALCLERHGYEPSQRGTQGTLHSKLILQAVY